jgi:hypothetical protein
MKITYGKRNERTGRIVFDVSRWGKNTPKEEQAAMAMRAIFRKWDDMQKFDVPADSVQLFSCTKTGNIVSGHFTAERLEA